MIMFVKKSQTKLKNFIVQSFLNESFSQRFVFKRHYGFTKQDIFHIKEPAKSVSHLE